MQGQVDPYIAAWEELHRRRIAFCVVAASAIPMLWWSASTFDDKGWWAAVPLVAAVGITSTRIRRFLCPKCGNPFVQKFGWPGLLVDRCRWCRLKTWIPRGHASTDTNDSRSSSARACRRSDVARSTW
jgi:hypothetical protein